jgi:hypothetical protein
MDEVLVYNKYIFSYNLVWMNLKLFLCVNNAMSYMTEYSHSLQFKQQPYSPFCKDESPLKNYL